MTIYGDPLKRTIFRSLISHSVEAAARTQKHEEEKLHEGKK